MAMKIAVVGISAELPSGSTSSINLNHHSFYDFLVAGGQSYEDIPSERLNINAWQGNHLGQIKSKRGSFLKNVDLFDNVEFGVSNRDAQIMSPSTRKLIEHSFLALLDSGIDYRSRDVGCFVAGVNHLPELNEYDTQVSMSCPPSMISNRVSYHLDITGPSVPTDTACSSTCTAFHLACNSLRAGDCEAAIVGGCQLNLGFLDWFHYSQGSMLASDGKCKPFDASADGFSRSEGVVAIVLKPLDAALRDNDHIYATVLGTGLTATGSAAPLGAPVAETQSNAMLRAFKQANVSPQDVDFVECHGTGTAKGDPEEANWILRNFKRDREWWFGSVKGNIGHTEISAFLVSLSKVLSILEHGIIPPNVNLETKNPEIKWDGYASVPLVPTPLPCPSTGRAPMISIASTGLGGVNGHVIVEGYSHIRPMARETTPNSPRLILLTAGGLSPRSAGLVAESMSKSPGNKCASLAMLACKSARRTRQMTWRSYAVVDLSAESEVRFPPPVLSPRVKPPLVFIFSGQGPQYPGMGIELFDAFPVFRESILASDRTHKSVTGRSLLDDYGLFSPSSPCPLSGTWPVEVTLPAIAAFQMAIFDLLLDIGIKPDVVMGHSAGETAVLYASGAGSQAMAMEIAIARGQAFASIEHQGGTMAALSCNVQQANALINACGPGDFWRAEIACFNAPDAVAISGDTKSIESVLQTAASFGISGRRLKTDVPIHSSMIELCSTTYQALMNEVFARYPGNHSPKIPTYSPTTGSLITSFTAESFWLNARLPVQFTSTLAAVGEAYGPSLQFVEVSSHPVLSAYVSMIFQDANCIAASAKRPRSDSGPKSLEHHTFLELLGRLLLKGLNDMNFSKFYGVTSDVHEVPMASYPFQPKSFPIYSPGPLYQKQIASHHGPLNHPYLQINQLTHPSLAEHSIRQQPALCASGFLEMVRFHDANATMLRVLAGVRIWRSCADGGKIPSHSFPDFSPTDASFCTPGWLSLVYQLEDNLPPQYILFPQGFLSFEKPGRPPCVDLTDIRILTTQIDELYPSLEQLRFGPTFQRIFSAQYDGNEALATIRCKAADLLEHDYVLHPAIIDACIQICCYVPLHGNTDPNVYYLPDSVEVAILHASPKFADLPDLLYAHCVLRQWTPTELCYDVVGCDEDGIPLFTLNNLKLRLHLVEPPRSVTMRYDIVEQQVFDDSLTVSSPGQASLFNTEMDICFHFVEGREAGLRSHLSKLENTHMLTIWITALNGASADKATGLFRALVKEYPNWTMRMALFDEVFDTHGARMLALRRLPASLNDESEFTFASDGYITVPRIYPLPSILPGVLPSTPTSIIIPSSSSEISDHTAGLLVAALAPSLSAFRNKRRLAGLRVLLTHSQSSIGCIVSQIYRALDVDLTELCEDVTALSLYQCGAHSYDLVISGASDPTIYQIAAVLLRHPSSRLFFWNYGTTSLEKIRSAEPLLAQEALECSCQTVKQYSIVLQSTPSTVADSIQADIATLFSPQKSYVLLGGLGILGLHMALWMYSTGARHIIITSRSGASSLDNQKGLRRIVQYLNERKDLSFRVERFDAADMGQMKAFIGSLSLPLGGCFFMANSALDCPFLMLDDHDFTQAYRSTEGAAKSLIAAVDPSSLEFLVAISSVSAIFGISGQSSYAASKLALDGILKPLVNASSFICPPVAGTTLVKKVQERNEGYLVKWQITIQDYIFCLEDIIRLIRCKRQPTFYIPHLSWNEVDKDVGMPHLGAHLLNSHLDQSVPEAEAPSSYERLNDIVRKVLDVHREDLAPEVPLTSFGLDSLSASRLSLLLRTELSLQFNQIRLLANATLGDIQCAMRIKDYPAHSKTLETTDKVGQSVATTLRRFLPSPLVRRSSRSKPIAPIPSKVVLVTGTTGALGTHLLCSLLASKVTLVYCLNRRNSTPAIHRQKEQLRRHGLPEDISDSPAITFIDYDPGLPMMGLTNDILDKLRSSVTHIIHNAWTSDFAASLPFFDDLLMTTRSLLNIACTSTVRTSLSFVFISSVGVCQLAQSQGPVREEFITQESLNLLPNVKIADKSGYVQSKWVAEELIRCVGEDYSFRTCVIRAGVLSGSLNGAWDTSQWFPSLVKSAFYLKCLPTGHDAISWIPIDLAAKAVIEFAQNSATGMIHLVHPRPTMWSSLITEIASDLSVPLVSYPDWLELLEQDTRNPTSSLHQLVDGPNPAIPLLDFFRQAQDNLNAPRNPSESLGLTVKVDSRRGQEHSSLLCDPNLPCLSPDDARNWLMYWRAIGFLPPA
ncbi:hypothetical protein ONZ45_g7609 [Pleurotus djamor]|nr:hypothetical protein ONZ45_g7609 [Pleurotus djamor]